MMPSVVRDKTTGVIYRRWECPFPEAVFLLVHGLGAHSGRWDLFASYFLQQSISSYAIDLRGFGETPQPKGYMESFNLVFKDIQDLKSIIQRETGGKPVFIIGESMGGLISYLFIRRQPRGFRGLVCLSPVFRSRLKFGWRQYLRVIQGSFWDVQRPLQTPLTHQMCTRDSTSIREMENDPLEHRFAAPRLLLSIALAGLRARVCPAALKIPVLFLVSGSDVIVDPAATRKVFELSRSGDKEFISYPEMYHALSVELGREQVFQDILRWTRARIRGVKR